MRLDVDKERNFIDLWNPEKTRWERYVKVNDEIEIIKDKKIEKLWFSLYEMERVNKEVLEKIENKINEIIDKINEMEEK